MKIIIDNKTKLPDREAIKLVSKVICKGKILGMYNYISNFKVKGVSIIVRASKNKGSDRFVIVEE